MHTFNMKLSQYATIWASYVHHYIIALLQVAKHVAYRSYIDMKYLYVSIMHHTYMYVVSHIIAEKITIGPL